MQPEEFNVSEIEEKIGYKFKNKELLKQAFTRRSYQNENADSEHNELLEFIGDSIIGVSVVKFITSYYQNYEYEELTNDDIELIMSLRHSQRLQRFYCHLDEAELSELKIKFVQRSSLAYSIERLGLEKYLVMSVGDIKNDVASGEKAKEDLFEAIIGAIAIDSGWDMNILDNIIANLLDIENRLENGNPGEPDYIELLNTRMLEYGGKPIFKEINTGEKLKYRSKVDLGHEMLLYIEFGYGKTIYGAQQMAAKRALKFIEKTKKRAETIAKTITKPDSKRAVNQLNELYQKKIISEPVYDIIDQGESWQCYCSVDDACSDCCIAEKKMDAKQMAAESLLKILLSNYKGPSSILCLRKYKSN